MRIILILLGVAVTVTAIVFLANKARGLKSKLDTAKNLLNNQPAQVEQSQPEAVSPAPDPAITQRQIQRFETALENAERRQEQAEEKHREEVERLEKRFQDREREIREREKEVEFIMHKFEHRPAPALEEIKELLGDEAIVDERSNTVIVRTNDKKNLEKLRDVLQSIDVAPVERQYQVDAVLVSAQLIDGEQFSIDWLFKYETPEIGKFARVAAGPGRIFVNSTHIDLTIDNARDQGRLAILARPLLILSDTEKARISSGREIPIPVSNVSDGNVQTSVEFRSVALDLEVQIREVSRDVVILSVKQINSDVAGEVLIGDNSIPQLVTQQFESQLTPTLGRWYAIGGVATLAREETKRKGLHFLNRRNQSKERREIGMFVRLKPVIPTEPPADLSEVRAVAKPVFDPPPALRAIPVFK